MDTQLIKFYLNEGPNVNGYYLDDMLSFDNQQLMLAPNWIDWLFPIEQTDSSLAATNLDNDTITIMLTLPKIQQHIHASFFRMMSFYRLNIGDLSIKPWFVANNSIHYKYLAQMLRSIRFIENEGLMQKILSVTLGDLYVKYSDDIGESWRKIWQDNALYHTAKLNKAPLTLTYAQ